MELYLIIIHVVNLQRNSGYAEYVYMAWCSYEHEGFPS